MLTKPTPNSRAAQSAWPLFTIRLAGSGDLIANLEVDQVREGDRDKFKNLIKDGGVQFRTLAGKLFFLNFGQFQFVL